MSVIPGETLGPPQFPRWQPQVFRQSFSMAAGANVVFLPGYQRAASLNPATFTLVTDATKRGGFRWLQLQATLDAVHAAGDDTELSTSFGTFKSELAFIQGASIAGVAANTPISLIRGCTVPFIPGFQASVWVPDPMLLFVRKLSMAGTETLTISGVFLETNNRDLPPPDPYISH